MALVAWYTHQCNIMWAAQNIVHGLVGAAVHYISRHSTKRENHPHFNSLVYNDLPSHLRERPPATLASIPWLQPPLPHEPHTHMPCHKYVARAVLDTTCLLRVCRRALGHAITNARTQEHTHFGIWHLAHSAQTCSTKNTQHAPREGDQTIVESNAKRLCRTPRRSRYQ